MAEVENVVAFPTQDVRIWRQIETALRIQFNSVGSSPECTEFVIGRAKAAFSKLNCDISVTAPCECEPAMKDLGQQYQNVISAHFFELCLCYIELWGLGAR